MKTFLLIVMAAAIPASARAADWQAQASFLTDYRDRGVSQSDEDPALQGGVDVDVTGAFRLSAWGSTLKNNPRGDAEINIGASYAGGLGALGYWTVGAQGVFYPGGRDLGNHGEVYGIVGVQYAIFDVSLGANYAPDYDRAVGGDNLYTDAQVNAFWPGKPMGATLTLGHDHFADGPDKWDWSAGVFYDWKVATFTLRYVDTDSSSPNADAAVVFGMKLRF